jgi:hypothetical protein
LTEVRRRAARRREHAAENHAGNARFQVPGQVLGRGQPVEQGYGLVGVLQFLSGDGDNFLRRFGGTFNPHAAQHPLGNFSH